MKTYEMTPLEALDVMRRIVHDCGPQNCCSKPLMVIGGGGTFPVCEEGCPWAALEKAIADCMVEEETRKVSKG